MARTPRATSPVVLAVAAIRVLLVFVATAASGCVTDSPYQRGVLLQAPNPSGEEIRRSLGDQGSPSSWKLRCLAARATAQASSGAYLDDVKQMAASDNDGRVRQCASEAIAARCGAAEREALLAIAVETEDLPADFNEAVVKCPSADAVLVTMRRLPRLTQSLGLPPSNADSESDIELLTRLVDLPEPRTRTREAVKEAERLVAERVERTRLAVARAEACLGQGDLDGAAVALDAIRRDGGSVPVELDAKLKQARADRAMADAEARRVEREAEEARRRVQTEVRVSSVTMASTQSSGLERPDLKAAELALKGLWVDRGDVRRIAGDTGQYTGAMQASREARGRLLDALIGALGRESRGLLALHATTLGVEVGNYLQRATERRGDQFRAELQESPKLDALAKTLIAAFEAKPFCAAIPNPKYSKGAFRITAGLGDAFPSQQLNQQDAFTLARSERGILTYGTTGRVRCRSDAAWRWCDIDFNDIPESVKDLLESSDSNNVTTLACLSGKLKAAASKTCMGPVCIGLVVVSSARLEFRILKGDEIVWRTSR